jgi:DNA-binding IclR family transcriptional regulator
VEVALARDAELALARREGWAANRSESIDGVSSYGVPIFGHGAVPIAGISVGASGRIEAKRERILGEIVPAARRLSEDLRSA